MSIEDRRKSAMDLLGALFLAMSIFLPVFLWWIGVIKSSIQSINTWTWATDLRRPGVQLAPGRSQRKSAPCWSQKPLKTERKRDIW